MPEHDLPQEIFGSHIKVLGKAVFIVLRSNGVKKVVMTDRLGATMLRDLMTAALENPNNNKNGVTFIRDERL